MLFGEVHLPQEVLILHPQLRKINVKDAYMLFSVNFNQDEM